MDQDGANPVFLTQGDYLVLTPRFNPTAQMIAYMSYIGGRPRVYLFDLETGRQEMLGNFPNMTFCAAFLARRQSVVMALENNGNSDIYLMDLATRTSQRLTNDPGDRHRALLFARRTADHLRIEPRRLAADLCDECRRLECPAHQLRSGTQRNAGVEPARRSDRLHANRFDRSMSA